MKDDSQDRPESGQTSEQKPRQDPETRLNPELREWARRQFADEEIVAARRELREKGGVELGNFLQELEQIVTR